MLEDGENILSLDYAPYTNQNKQQGLPLKDLIKTHRHIYVSVCLYI